MREWGQLSRMARARLRQISATSRNDAGLRGRLEQFGLATVLSFLDLERCPPGCSDVGHLRQLDVCYLRVTQAYRDRIFQEPQEDDRVGQARLRVRCDAVIVPFRRGQLRHGEGASRICGEASDRKSVV